jgi:hypothetical protein
MITKVAIFVIQCYQNSKFRHRLPPCLFEPSCSQYATIALKKYGILMGTIKIIKRLLRCKPPKGGIDLP